MFVGHVGAGLLLKRAERRINLGVLGVESVVVPEDFSAKHYLTFVFPYSHGLSASAGWALLAVFATWGGLGSGFQRRLRFAAVVTAAVLSRAR